MAEDMKDIVEAGIDDQTSDNQQVQNAEHSLLDKVKNLLGMGKEESKNPEALKDEVKKNPDEMEKDLDKKDVKDLEPAEKEKKYSQGELEEAVKAAKEALLEEQKEAARKAKLTPEELAAEEQNEVKKQNQELAGKLHRMELEQKASKALAEKQLPSGLAEFLDYTDEEKMMASLEKIGKMYQADLEAGIKERLKGKTPKGLGGAGNLTDSMISAEISKRIRGGL